MLPPQTAQERADAVMFERCRGLAQELHEYNKRVRPGWFHVVVEQCSDALMQISLTAVREPSVPLARPASPSEN